MCRISRGDAVDRLLITLEGKKNHNNLECIFSVVFSMLQVSFQIVLTVRSSCELETYIVSVERVKEYSDAPTEVTTLATINVYKR